MVLTWEAASRAGLVSALYFPAPTAIARTLFAMAESGELALHFRATLSRLLAGLALGGVPGLALGLVMGWSNALRRLVDPFVAAVHPIPKIAVLPLVMVLFGIGETSKILVVGVTVFFPMLINTMGAVRQIDPLYFDAARNYGAGFLKLLTRVLLPGSLPMVLSGLRLSLNIGLLVTIAVEIVAGDTGLGSVIWLAWEVLRTEALYASLLVVSLLGIGFRLLVDALFRVLVPWHPSSSPATV